MLDALFQIIVYPVYAMIEVVFYVVNNYLAENLVLTILVISFIVNMFCLPLYMNAEKLQNEELEIQKKLKKRVESIKKNFKGDERQMLLQTYYRQNNYHPVMSLRLSFSLLLQIPFFIAAYLFFSHCNALHGFQFFMINDLSQPDRLIKIGKFSINFLPILMTAINIYSGSLYTKKYDGKGSLQLWIMSIIFLVLLYNSPAGLVIYWTFNNIFSLIKNIALLSDKPKDFFIYFLFFVVAAAYFVCKKYSIDLDLIVYILFFALLSLKLKIPDRFLDFNPKKLFILSSAALILIFGLLIPTGVIATSPSEFLIQGVTKNSFEFVKMPFFQYLGLFGFWGYVFYTLSSKHNKRILTCCSLLFLSMAIFNMIYFKMPKAVMDFQLRFENPDIFQVPVIAQEMSYYIIGLEILLAVIFVLIYKKKIRLLQNSLIVIIIAALSVCSVNAKKIYYGCKNYTKTTAQKGNDKVFDKVIHFSKGKNVLVIFLDRGISSFVPLAFETYPELKDEYRGFVYYPNTVSFHGHTVFGYPPITGGYEYTPVNMAKNKTERFNDIYDKSHLVLPEIFKNANYNTLITDSKYVGFEEESSPEFYTKRGHQYQVLQNKFIQQYSKEKVINNAELIKMAKRNFFWYSFLPVAPKYLRAKIYDHGIYFNYNYGIVYSNITNYLLGNYSELYYLPKITDNKSVKNSFILINNEITHHEGSLQTSIINIKKRILQQTE